MVNDPSKSQQGSELPKSDHTYTQLYEEIQHETASPISSRVYGAIVYWLAVVSAVIAIITPVFIFADSSHNILDPNTSLNSVLGGEKPEDIWALSTTGAFPGAHYYLNFISKADSWAMISVSLICSISLWGLIPAIIVQVRTEKNYFTAGIGTLLALLIILSMTGVLSNTG